MSLSSFAAPRASRMAVAVAAAIAICSSTPASAADAAAAVDAPPQATTLDTIDVHAQWPRTAPSVEQARDRLAERAGATAVVDAESYRDGRASTLTDALGQAPGVFVQSRFGAEEARISIRGSGLQRTFHGRGIELLQDGSPLNLADGSFDMQAVEPLSARYIEVWRGANALEYGAATLGGAINFVSPTGYDTAPSTARAEAGSFGYRRGQAAAAGNDGALDGYASFTGFSQDGFREHAKQQTYRLFGNAGFRFSETLDGRLYYTHVDTQSELPGSLTRRQALDDPRRANAGNVLLDQRRDFQLDRVAGRLAWAPSAGAQLTLSAWYADKSLHHPIFQVLEQHNQDAGIDVRWRNEGQLGAHRNVLIAGVTLARGDTDDDRFVNVRGSAGARTNQFAQRAVNAKLYAENQTWLTDAWTLVVGAQALHASRRSRDLYVTGGRDESFDVDYSGFSPKLGVRYLFDADTQLFANVSRSLEPPSFGELSGGPNVTQVDEQRATSGEIGLRVQRQRLDVDAVLYRARIAGELLALSDGNGNPLGTVNAGRTLHQGIEFGLGWQLAPSWRINGNYLRNDFRFDRDRVYGDNRLAGVPPQLLRAELRWNHGTALYIAPNLEWAPQAYYVDHANTLQAPGHAVLGIKVGGAIGAEWSWFADARNLTGRRWIATTDVVADASVLADPALFLPGDGRSVYVGVQWRMQ